MKINQLQVQRQIALFIALVVTLSLNGLNTAHAMIETYSFKTEQQEQDYKILIDELRCLVCQNQNLADSNAELAQDLRKQVHHMLVDKELNRHEIVDYMVDRYGDFVLYNPPVKSHTYLLWLGPLLFLLIGFWVAYRIIRESKPTGLKNATKSNSQTDSNNDNT